MFCRSAVASDITTSTDKTELLHVFPQTSSSMESLAGMDSLMSYHTCNVNFAAVWSPMLLQANW